MWKRCVKVLVCPICKGALELSGFRETAVAISDEDTALAKTQGVYSEEFNQFIESGVLLCHGCKNWHPITRGLPILLPYRTRFHEQFAADCREELSRLKLKYDFPNQDPVSGERFVMDSFSQEWSNYAYDGVWWNVSYQDCEQMLLREVDFNPVQGEDPAFLEIGCGLGITTYLAHKNYKGDAVGVDLSFAAMRASDHYRTNPFLHFVQATAFYLPFKEESFDIVYSHGVLHHTYSTREAFKAVARRCRPGGRLFIWLYGPLSKETWARMLAYRTEVIARPILSRQPSSFVARIFLFLAAFGYMAFNAFQRVRNPDVQSYNFERALHAARDRFTPQYAHRHDDKEVQAWFREADFDEIEVLDWRLMPPAQQESFRRSVGVRGRRKVAAAKALGQMPEKGTRLPFRAEGVSR